MWIASQSGRIERSPWLLKLMLKLLRQEKDVIDLMETDPWRPTPSSSSTNGETSPGSNVDGGSVSPKYIRIEKYRYKFYDPKKDSNTNEIEENPPYWVRKRVGRYFPRQGIMTADMLDELVNRH